MQAKEFERNDLTDEIQAALYRPQGNPVITIPIKKLVHTTHFQVAEDISNLELNDSKYTFIPQKKCGRPYAPGSLAPSGDTAFDQISSSECVFCVDESCSCKFSWWGIDISDWYKGEGAEGKGAEGEGAEGEGAEGKGAESEGAKFGRAVKALTDDKKFMGDVFKNPPESNYGTQGFSISFSTLMEQYKESREKSDEKVCFRIGGTLQYRQEIMYVVIVCMASDKSLDKYPPIDSHNDKFSHQGLDASGLISDNGPKIIPEFKIKYFITNSQIPHCWEGLAFGLYLPDGNLKCIANKHGPAGPGITRFNVPHVANFCHEMVKDRTFRSCPDYNKQTQRSRYPQLSLCETCARYPKPLHKFKCPKHGN